MDLLFTEEQKMLREMTRRLCEDVVPLPVLRTLEGHAPGYSTACWQSMGEVGLSGLSIGEPYGGLGLGATELMIAHEEFGRGLVLSPHFVSSVLAASLLEVAGSQEQQRRWLPDIASGTGIVTVASLEADSGDSLTGIQCRASRVGGRLQLNGTKYLVPYAPEATALLVLARTGAAPDAVIACLVDRTSPGLSMEYQANLAGEALYRVELSDVALDDERVLKGGESIVADWQTAMYRSLIALAAQAVGGAARVHDMTVDYAKVREAFGKPIGAFQAIAHYLADVAVEVEGCRTLLQQAAWALDQGYPFRRLAAMAKLQCCEMYRRAAAVAIQVHGGMGYTIDADPQLFYRRAKQLQAMHWSAEFLEERIAALYLQETPDTGWTARV
jgi:alkylation response protein AidB-like acyl-CoA dehydrogenase